MTVQQILVKQLGALPAIREYLERLRLKERVDAVAPVRDVARLTNGDVVVALVANRLTAPRPLYDIVELGRGLGGGGDVRDRAGGLERRSVGPLPG